MKRVYELDGKVFQNLEEFASHFSKQVLPGRVWNGNLDAFNDILRGGFGTPKEGFILRIKNSSAARQALGYPETCRWLEERSRNCHPSNRQRFRDRLKTAQDGTGETIFDTILEIIRDHGRGGKQSDDKVDLELE